MDTFRNHVEDLAAELQKKEIIETKDEANDLKAEELREKVKRLREEAERLRVLAEGFHDKHAHLEEAIIAVCKPFHSGVDDGGEALVKELNTAITEVPQFPEFSKEDIAKYVGEGEIDCAALVGSVFGGKLATAVEKLQNWAEEADANATGVQSELERRQKLAQGLQVALTQFQRDQDFDNFKEALGVACEEHGLDESKLPSDIEIAAEVRNNLNGFFTKAIDGGYCHQSMHF